MKLLLAVLIHWTKHPLLHCPQHATLGFSRSSHILLLFWQKLMFTQRKVIFWFGLRLWPRPRFRFGSFLCGMICFWSAILILILISVLWFPCCTYHTFPNYFWPVHGFHRYMGLGPWVLGPWVYPEGFCKIHGPTEKLFFASTHGPRSKITNCENPFLIV